MGAKKGLNVRVAQVAGGGTVSFALVTTNASTPDVSTGSASALAVNSVSATAPGNTINGSSAVTIAVGAHFAVRSVTDSSFTGTLHVVVSWVMT
jgi:hypothetical protein